MVYEVCFGFRNPIFMTSSCFHATFDGTPEPVKIVGRLDAQKDVLVSLTCIVLITYELGATLCELITGNLSYRESQKTPNEYSS